MKHSWPFYENRKKSFDCHIWKHPNYPNHIHKHLEFAYAADGEITTTITNQTHTLTSGECILIPPNQIHSYSSCGDVSLLLIIVDMDLLEDFQEELKYLELENPFFHKQQLSAYGQGILNLLLKSATDAHVPYLIHKGLFTVLLTDIFCQINCKYKSSATELKITERLLQYIDNHRTEDLTAAKVASALGISHYYLSHVFSKELKISFPTYVASQRLSLACNMLENTDKAITEIVYASGFSNMRTFHRNFEIQYGCTPSTWRKLNKKPLIPNSSTHLA